MSRINLKCTRSGSVPSGAGIEQTGCTHTRRCTYMHTVQNLCCLQAAHTGLPRRPTAALCTHPAHILLKLGKRQPQDPSSYFKREKHFNAEA